MADVFLIGLIFIHMLGALKRVMDGDGHLRGRLVGQFFQGAQSRLLVDVGGAQPLLVDSAENVVHATGALIALAVEPQVLFTLHP